jgi:U3 small nucleolar RNA-associated protein 16
MFVLGQWTANTEDRELDRSAKAPMSKADGSKLHKTEKSSASTRSPPARPKHIRFDSEEPVAPTVPLGVEEIEQHSEELEDEDEDDESDDEAPEAVTRSVALEQAAKEEIGAAEWAAREEAATAEKRRRKEERQKEEAEARRVKLAKSKSTSSKLNVDLANLPTFLPEELLASAPEERPPTPPRAVKASHLSEVAKKKQHLKFLDAPTKTPKDRKGFWLRNQVGSPKRFESGGYRDSGTHQQRKGSELGTWSAKKPIEAFCGVSIESCSMNA